MIVEEKKNKRWKNMMALMEIYNIIVPIKQRETKQILNDVVKEILMRLPVRSLVRFQTVSKHWGSLIKSRDFGGKTYGSSENQRS
ncbi:hypothetical protein YC2023_061828 [Brassica napus]